MNAPVVYNTMDEFLSNTLLDSQEGLLRPNRFAVAIEIPAIVDFLDEDLTDLTEMGRILSFGVQSVQCPNIGIEMGVINTNNQVLNYMKERSDADLSVTFLEDSNLTVRRFFNGWMRAGYDPATKARRYPKDIWAEHIQVHPVHADGKTSKSGDIFFRCIPYDIIDMNYDMSAENSIQKIEVKFKYSVHDVVNVSRSRNYILG